MTLNPKYHPLNVIQKFDEFMHDLKELKNNSGILSDLKLIWYTRYRYPKLRKLLAKSFFENALFALKNPDCFINIITAYVATLISLRNDEEGLKEMINGIYADKPPFTLFFKLTPKNTIEKYIVNFKGVLPKNSEYDPDRLITLILDVNINTTQCSLERTVYNTNSLDQIVNVRAIDHKILNISPNGNLYNENYIFDENIKKEDYKLYAHCIATLMAPFLHILDYITHPLVLFTSADLFVVKK